MQGKDAAESRGHVECPVLRPPSHLSHVLSGRVSSTNTFLQSGSAGYRAAVFGSWEEAKGWVEVATCSVTTTA